MAYTRETHEIGRHGCANCQFILAPKATVTVWTEDKSRPYGPSSAMLTTPAMLSRPPRLKMSHLTLRFEGHSSSPLLSSLPSFLSALCDGRSCFGPLLLFEQNGGRRRGCTAAGRSGRMRTGGAKTDGTTAVAGHSLEHAWVSHAMLQSIFPQLCRPSIPLYLKQHFI